MRYLFLLLSLAALHTLAPASAQAQSGEATVHATIAWQGYAEVPSRSERKQRVPTFEGAYMGLNEQVGTFSLRLEGAVSAGQVVNPVYEPFSVADARLFTQSQLPAGPVPQLTEGTEMKRTITYMTLRPVRRNPQSGQLERLVSFDYTYTQGRGNVAARGRLGNRTHAAHSVLATGDWYKVGVAEAGIYKLDKATLRNMGVNVQSIDPSRLKVYGNSMGVLPQANDVYRPDDLVENAVQFVGDNNGVFEDSEYLLFYSPGAHTWKAQGDLFRHQNNVYTDTTYYFVTVGTTAGRRVAPVASPVASGTVPTISTFTDRYFHEHDLVNLLRSGRHWMGEGFSNGKQRDIVFSNIPDLVPGAPIRITALLVASAIQPSSFALKLNNTRLGDQPLSARPTTYDHGAIATLSTLTHQIALPAGTGSELRINLAYNSPADPTAAGYLDYLEVNAQRQLRLSGSQLAFRSFENVAPQAVSRFALANATGATVWDVTNPRHARVRPLDNSGTFLAPTDSLREFVAFQPTGSFPTPRTFGRVANQDLHALNGQTDLVIVTHPVFRAEALRLAQHRTTRDGLRTAVVTTSEVYNEFGSGGQDITAIRDLMKQIYDRAPAGKSIQLLLFGDASYDYKSDPANNKDFEPGWWSERAPFKTDPNFDRANQNYVPTYESRESFAPFYGDGAYGQASYSSDDFYALLDDNEGEWEELTPGTELLDIGVGRLPVRTPKEDPRSTTQARQMVDKIIAYDAPTGYGKWRNRITFASDDGNSDRFITDSENIVGPLKTSYPTYNIHKTYLDLYPQVSVAAGQRSPDAKRAIDESIEQGSLIVNYLGHGGPKGWTDEQLVTNASVMALQNSNNLTFMMTGTCDFSTFDNPDFTSAGEQIMTDNATGGAIGLFTTTRVVEAGLNYNLTQSFYRQVLRPVNISGQMPTIGTVVMLTKNNYPGPGSNGVINNRNYTLLADPSMHLAYPAQTVVLDSISGVATSRTGRAADSLRTLRALSRVRLSGRVLNNGALNTNFTGTAQITIFDKPTTVKTLGDEAGDKKQDISVQENIIYGGQATVVNGLFTVTFIVPKDINYQTGFGKISLYASDNTRRVDAHGYQLTPVGEAALRISRDTIPPDITLFMDNEAFVFGGLTGQNAKLIAKLYDESGINTTGTGIGHDITATIDNNPENLLILNSNYVGKVGDFRAGTVEYPYKDLAVGPHVLHLKAWDTYNNSSERDIEFIVAHNEQLALNHVLNYPNPFASTTTFHFDHNRSGDDLEVQVQIFTVSGKLVRTLTSLVPGSEAHQKAISWNGRDDYDDQLARGLYVYRISVRSPRDGSSASKYEKLVILN